MIDTTSEVQIVWTDSAAALSSIRFLSWSLHTVNSNQISVPADERGHLFGLPLSQRLLHSPLAMTAWLANYRAGQLRLTSHTIRQDKCRQSTIRQFFICCATPPRPSSPVLVCLIESGAFSRPGATQRTPRNSQGSIKRT